MKETEFSQEQSYRTGATNLPKSYGGLVAVLLVLVILFGGLAGVLGIINIRLKSYIPMVEKGEPVEFVPGSEAVPAQTVNAEGEGVEIPALGLSVAPVTPFLQEYYGLPQGVYITALNEDCGARAAGCLPGDMILGVNNRSVTTPEELNAMLDEGRPHQPVVLTIYRGGETYAIRIQMK